ncbi:MAG: ABC transporter ATP-binding protein/permease [Oscillospiraceae bacterium]|nr:ABC transporter ATP-binding protein/permease [Oscillospiraceae bacterium]
MSIVFKKRKIINNGIYSFRAVWKIDGFAVFLYGLNVMLEKIQPFLYIFLPKILLDELTSDNAGWHKIICIILAFILAIAAANFIQRGTYSQTSAKLSRYRLEKNKELALKIMDIDYAYMENPETLNNFNLAKSAVSNYNTGMEGMMREMFWFVFCLLTVIGYVSILATLNIFMVLALVMAAVASYLIKQKIAEINISKREEIESCDRKMRYYSSVMSDFSYGKEIRIFDIKKFLADKYTLFDEAGMAARKKAISKRQKWNFLLNAINLTKGIACYGCLLFSAFEGNMQIGSFLLYFGALGGFTGWIEDITGSLAGLREINVQVDDYRNFMNIPGMNNRNEKKEISSVDKIEFKNVWFKYPGTENYVLKNISLCLNKGDKLAVVGRNGGGKTTLVKLLCGLYEPNKGEILYNGINLRDLNREDYAKQLAVIFQTINIFAFSTKANVALCAKGEIDDKKVLESLKSADVDYILSKNKNGLDMSLSRILDDEGIELSGGENQKIALARAVYRGGSVIILDEPTSHLDALAEKRIYDSYQKITEGKISLFISHRLASAKFCDNIVMIENGEIAETGPHDFLIGQNGKYAEMFDIQSAYYKDGEAGA